MNAAGHQRFPSVYGFMLTGNFIGTGLGAPAWGLVFDLTGNFTLAMYAGGALGLTGLLLAYIGLGRGLKVRKALEEPNTAGIEIDELDTVSAR